MPKTAKAKRKAKRKSRANARPNVGPNVNKSRVNVGPRPNVGPNARPTHLSNLFNAMPKGPLRISQRVATPYPQVRCKTFRL